MELLKDACKKQKRQNKPLINKAADPVRELNRKSVEFAFQIFLLSADLQILTAAPSTQGQRKTELTY